MKVINHPNFIRSVLVSIITIASILTTQTLHAVKEIDKTAAIVGNDIIFQSEIDRKIRIITANLKNKKPNKDILTERALENIIQEKLQLNIARNNNVSISPEELKAAVKRVKKNIHQQGTNIKEHLKKQGLSNSEFEDEIRKEILIKRVQQRVINQRIRISEQEIDNFIASKTGQEWLTPKFHLGHIFLPATEKNKTNVLRNAKKLHRSLENPKTNFRRAAERYSKGPNAQKGGDMGVLTKDDMPSLFSERIISLQSGDITEPFISDAGVHILKVFNRAGAQPVVITQYETRHILVKTTELFTEEEAINKINNLYNRLTQGEDFIKIAQEYTDDVGSKFDGGHLGWSLPGKFVPAFEKAMKATPVGKLSKPFKSQFGWHILRVEQTREKDIFEKVKRSQIAKLLRSQRFNDELKLWLQDLREQAYVEILI